ncbi:MAG: response regulator, partial [Treponema sp.]|nr:response regulator [Treponema sp.]
FNVIPLGLSGCAIGMISRTYVVNYLDRKVSEKNLDLEKAKAESKAKSEFLTFVNHEIRSPMNTIVGLNEMILRESKDSIALGYSKEIKQACGTLSLLINDVLDFSKINSNDFSLVPVEYNLDALLNELLSIVVPRAQEKNLEFNVSIQEDTPNNLIGDDMRIKQCVMNLLSNAIKYTDKGSVTLLVTWKQASDDDHCISLTFAVADTGCGIKPSDIDRIASPFERLDELKNRNIEGSGLGLSIVKGLLKKMDSSLHITSEYGVGSNFSFTIRQPIELNVPIGKYTEHTYAKERKGVSVYGTFLAPTARILVVDDLKMNRDIVCALLKCTQINIDTASSGNEAIELVKNNQYDVVLLDHRMPGLDGIDTLRAIKALDVDFADETKFIALTANASHGYKALYLQEGFDDYLPKPVDSEELERMLVRMLPKDLIRMQEVPMSQEDNESKNVNLSEPDNSRFIAMYSGIEGVDCNAALSLCRNVSALHEAVWTFYNDSEAKIADLKQDFVQCSLKSYIIAVHSLKTELRVIGFDSLSKQASLLEFFSDNGDIESVRDYTPDFIENLQHFRDKIRCLITKPKTITSEEYQDLIKSLKECSQVQDMKAVERMLLMVDGFAMPEGEESFFTLLRQSVRNGNIVLFKRLIDSH